jgi:nucleotide-binding universal stress UspA family protein
MIHFKNVLCPVDFFPASQRALEYSMGVAKNYQARLHILHVVSPVMPTSYEFSLNTADLLRTFEQQSMERVEQLKTDALSAGVTTETYVRVGDIDEELKRVIHESDADLVVMGTHGRRGFERWFLGSVTERLLRHCAVPVLTLSDLGTPIRVPPDINKILVTTDFSEGTSTAMSYALALAQEAPSEVVLLHVVQQPPERREPAEGIATILEEHLSSMVSDDVRNWCDVRAHVEVGTPYQRILALAEEIGVDLIVMNIHGKGMLDRALMGATAERVLRAAQCPVLAVPAKASTP